MKTWTAYYDLSTYAGPLLPLDRIEIDIPAESREGAQDMAAEIRETMRAALLAAGNTQYICGLRISGAPTGEVPA